MEKDVQTSLRLIASTLGLLAETFLTIVEKEDLSPELRAELKARKIGLAAAIREVNSSIRS